MPDPTAVAIGQQPNTFLLGAPKCGTTAMARYLAEHPQAFLSEVKEPHYYATDMPGLRYVSERDDYLRLFEAAEGNPRVVGEASVYYLYSQNAVSNILADCPTARFLVMLRNPVDLAHALHGEHCSWLVEDADDFEIAWRLQDERAQGRCLPPHCLDPAVLQYRHVAALGTQVERLLQTVHASQVKFILFDDFAADTARLYAETIEFLGLESDGRQEFRPVNAAVGLRSPRLQAMIRQQRFPLWMRRWGRSVGLHRVHEWLRQMNTYPAPRQPLRAGFRQELYDHFRPEVEALARLIGRDLSHWLDEQRNEQESLQARGAKCDW